MIQDMTTAEWRKAWTEIAIAFEKGRKRDEKWYANDITPNGLCYAWKRVTDGSEEFYDLARSMRNCDDDYWFPTIGEPKWNRKHDLLRSTFAAMFAAMTPREFLAICEAPR